jgi:AMP-polyphosphate phosphotransferase
MVKRTDHRNAPWHLVAGDNKRYARVAVVETVCAAIEADLLRRGYDLSGPDPIPGDATD